MSDAMPGNPHYGADAPDYAATTDGREVTAAILALAHEQRTANLIALMTIYAQAGIPNAAIREQVEARLGLDVTP